MHRQGTFGAGQMMAWFIIVLVFSYVTMMTAMWLNASEKTTRTATIAAAAVGSVFFYFLYRYFEG
ncbi:MAG: hypothetical protein AAF362_16095 [Pseudomonadota bacterium]